MPSGARSTVAARCRRWAKSWSAAEAVRPRPEHAGSQVRFARNPVRVNPRKRKLKAAKARPVHLDGADQIIALLDAARELDVAPKSRTSGRLALIATLLFAGARDDEIGHALVRDLDLARSRLEVGRSKTAAGMRTIDLLPVLHDVLAKYKASRPGTLDDLLFTTARGQRRDKDNINKGVLRPALERADKLLAQRGQHPLPNGVTPHKLRHTFAVDADRTRARPEIRHGAARPHRPEVHAAHLRARHALHGRRPGPSDGPCRSPGFGRN